MSRFQGDSGHKDEIIQGAGDRDGNGDGGGDGDGDKIIQGQEESH